MQFGIPAIPLPPGMVGFNAWSWTPVGTVTAYAGHLTGKTDPSAADNDLEFQAGGWMLCNGRPLEVLKYPELFNVLGDRYGGEGSGNSKTFKIPDYCGMFLRGVDHGSGNDPDVDDRTPPPNGDKKEVGSTQDDALESHRHCYPKTETTAKPGPSVLAILGNTDNTPTSAPKVDKEGGCTDLENVSKYETRPKNVYVNFIIKFTNYPAWSQPWPRFPFPSG